MVQQLIAIFQHNVAQLISDNNSLLHYNNVIHLNFPVWLGISTCVLLLFCVVFTHHLTCVFQQPIISKKIKKQNSKTKQQQHLFEKVKVHLIHILKCRLVLNEMVIITDVLYR